MWTVNLKADVSGAVRQTKRKEKQWKKVLSGCCAQMKLSAGQQW